MPLFSKPILHSHRWPLFVLLFGTFAGAILGDSTAEALLLARLGSKYVPGLFLINAAFLFLFSTVIMSVIDRIDRGQLFLGFVAFHCCVLLLIRTAIGADIPLLLLLLFSYAYVTKILLFMMFWTLTNDLIDSRRAGNEFPFIAAGGTLGAICISFTIPHLLRVISAENLLMVWVCGTALIGILFLPIKQSFGISFKPVGDRYRRVSFRFLTLMEDFSLVRSDPLLRTMAVFYFLFFFIILNQHYTFYSQLKLHFEGAPDQARELAKFLGYFNGLSMVTTFVMQMTISGPVIRKAGSTRSMFILPTALCLVFGALTFLGWRYGSSSTHLATVSTAALFWGVVLGMGTRIAFFDSFFSPNYQIFFSSLPQNVRGRGKLSIEGVVKPLAMVSAGIWLFVAAPRIPFTAQMLLLFVLSVVMISQTFRLKQKYTASLAYYLRGFKSKNTQLLRTINRASKETLFLDLAESVLQKEEPNVKAYVIDMLATMSSPESVAILVKHLPSAEPKTRATSISALSATKDPDLRKTFMEYLDDADERVVANCIEALANYRSADIGEKVSRFSNHSNPRIRANAIATLWPYTQQAEREKLIVVLRHMLELGYPRFTASALYAMGHVGFPNLVAELESYCTAHPERIMGNRMVWRQFAYALASTGQPESVDVILRVAEVASRKQRNQLSVALGMLLNCGLPADTMLSKLDTVNYMQRGVLLKALHVRSFDRRKESVRHLQNSAQTEIRSIYSHWLACAALGTDESNTGLVLLKSAIMEECINESLRNLFYVASMLDASGQIRRIVHRLFHTNRRERAQAFEVLDNTGDFHTNRLIVKLLESNDPSVHSREAVSSFKLKQKNRFSVLNEYANCPNTWVRECASYAMQCLLSEKGPAAEGAPA